MLLLVLFSLSLFLSPYTPPLYCSPSMNLLLLFFLFPCLVPPTITTTYHHHHHRLHCRWAAPGTLVKRVVLTCVATQPLPFAAASCTCDALSSTAEGPCRPSSSVRLEAKTIQKGFSWRQQCWNDFCFLFLCFLFFFFKISCILLYDSISSLRRSRYKALHNSNLALSIILASS